MESFFKEVVKGEEFEMIIDTQIFSKDIILKAAYNFLDTAYFFFCYTQEDDISLILTRKSESVCNLESVLLEFSDSLLESHLRAILEKDNQHIIQAICSKALLGPLDVSNFISLDMTQQRYNHIWNNMENILEDIVNDPDLDIDTKELQEALKDVGTDLHLDDDLDIQRPENVWNFSQEEFQLHTSFSVDTKLYSQQHIDQAIHDFSEVTLIEFSHESLTIFWNSQQEIQEVFHEIMNYILSL